MVPPASPERAAANAGIECIGCGVCYAACDVVAWDKDYLGPAALNRAWTLVNDVRDQGNRERIDAVSQRRRLPRVPHAHELHVVLPESAEPDLLDRRPEARESCGARA